MTSRLAGLLLAGVVLLTGIGAPNAAGEDELMAAVQVMGYGYKVTVLVNGADIGVQGGKSEGRRLFLRTSPMASKATPAVRARNFVLVDGANQIVVEFTRNDPKGSDALDVSLEVAGYPAPAFSLKSTTRASGKVERSVIVQKKPPPDFKPVVLTDADLSDR